MNIELYINGHLADLDKKDFSYNLQANDMFDFDSREFSYSEVIYLPTTSNNSKIFGYADIPTSDNAGAYVKYVVDYYVNGIAIVLRANGFLTGKRGNYFIFNFKDNSKDVFQLMVGKKLKDLPFEELNHEKKHTDIKKEYIGQKRFVYAIADYGGETFKVINQRPYFNLDHCPPSVKMDWILQKIKELNPNNPYIFKGNFFESELWKSLYMTVSDGRIHEIDGNVNENKAIYNKSGSCRSNGAYSDYNIRYNDDLRIFEEVTSGDTHFFEIPETGTYFIDIKGTIRGELYLNEKVVHKGSFNISEQIDFKNRRFDFEKGKKIALIAVGYPEEEDQSGQGGIIHQGQTTVVERLEVKIFRSKDVEFKNLISDMTILDWFKEVMRLFSLTPVKDDKTNNVQQFYTLSERVNEAPVLDWSEKYIKTIEEKFHDTNAYAQVNRFKYAKYNEQDSLQDVNDYDLIFKDQALIFEKEHKSKFFLGLSKAYETPHIQKIDSMFFFKKEFKEKDGKTIIEYKPQNNRFHIFNARSEKELLVVMRGIEVESAHALIADATLLQWQNLINSHYSDLPRIMEHLYCITCEMHLLEIDIHKFSFFSRIYLEQFGAYFIPNKITYKVGSPAVVELIKIRGKAPIVIDENTLQIIDFEKPL